jgi:hypothetical protein
MPTPPPGRRFQKGKSGNPGGRPKVLGVVQDLAKQRTVEAINTLAEVMNDKSAPPAARALAADKLLDRGWGKATQPISGDKDAPPIKYEFTTVYEEKPK